MGNRRALPDVNRLRQICDFYGISADELLGTQFCMSAAEANCETETAEPDTASRAPEKKEFHAG